MKRVTLAAQLLMMTGWAIFAVAPACYATVEPELTMAVEKKDMSRVLSLIAHGADVNERDEGSEQTPLMRAAQVNAPAIARVLIAHGALVNPQDDDGQTALTIAIHKGDSQIARLLMANGAKLQIAEKESVLQRRHP